MKTTTEGDENADTATTDSDISKIQDDYRFEFLEDLFDFKHIGNSLNFVRKPDLDFSISELLEALSALDVDIVADVDQPDNAFLYTPTEAYAIDILRILETLADLLSPDLVPKDRSVDSPPPQTTQAA